MIGDQDDYVEALQRRLKELGFFDTAPTGYFGIKTQQAVADYQSSAGLQADGKAGPLTLRAVMGNDFILPGSRTSIGKERSDTLYPGDNDSSVAHLQLKLCKLGFYSHGSATGYYGPVTKQAIKRFQRTNNLSVDGIAGPSTLDMLASHDAKSFCIFPGDRSSDVTFMQKRLAQLGFL